jgi:flagellar protein FlgJ
MGEKMSAKLVPTVKTTYNLNQLIKGLVEGWFKKFGSLPKRESIGVLYAQNALETGGTIAMWNNNIGNVKFQASKNPEADNGIEYMMLSNVWEIINGKKVIFQPPHPATWFRSFPTLGDGVAHHLDFLRNHRYQKAWTAVEAGSPAQFAHLLKVAGYYTAPEADYTNAMNIYFKRFMKDPTFDAVVASLQPKLNIDPATGNVTVSGELDLAPKPTTSPWGAVTGIFSSLFGKKS